MAIDPRRVGIGTDPERPVSRSPAERRAPEDRGARQPGKGFGLVRQRIDVAVGPGDLADPEPRQSSPQPPDDTPHALGHPPPATARTDTPPLAGEGQQTLERAVPASNAHEAVRQHAATEELPELAPTNVGSPTPSVRSRTVVANSLQCPRTTP